MNHGDSGRGGWFLVAAAVVYDIIAATNSSPQTTEVNAKHRAATLMKWVNIGTVQALAFIGIAAAGDRKNRGPILAGGILAAVAMYFQYIYAKACGIASGEKPTETFGEYWGGKSPRPRAPR